MRYAKSQCIVNMLVSFVLLPVQNALGGTVFSDSLRCLVKRDAPLTKGNRML